MHIHLLFLLILATACSSRQSEGRPRQGGNVDGSGTLGSGGQQALPTDGAGGVSGREGAPEEARETAWVEDECVEDIDVVFVLDVSGSMLPALAKLEAEVGRVDAAL